jgi:hypothetical protein
MKSLILRLSALFSFILIMSLSSCKLFEPQPFEYVYSDAFYSNWFEERKVVSRGFKYKIIFKGERLHFFQPTALVIGSHKLPVEAVIIEADERDLSSTLVVTAFYKETKSKDDKEFKDLDDTLFGLQPFENAVLEYEAKGKKNTLVIERFVEKFLM